MPRQVLSITMPDGKVLTSNNASDTFVECLKLIGIEQVAKMVDIQIDGLPLIVRQRDYRRQFKDAGDGWLVCTHSTTMKKKRILEMIVIRLGLQIELVLS